MVKAADIGSKRLVSLAPAAWARWLLGEEEMPQVELIESEFLWVSRTNDILIRVQSERHGLFLIANEIQLRPDPRMAQRMRAYAALAEERYDLPVLPVVVNVLPGTQPIPEQYYTEFCGLVARQDYRVIKLWEVDASLVFEQHLDALLPFVPVLHGGQELPIIKKAVQLLRQNERLQELEPLLAFFATFVVDPNTVREIMRWDMAVLRESPWYNEIVQEGYQQGLEMGLEKGLEKGLEQGLEQGIEKGLRKGLEQGITEGQFRLMLSMFEHRFGEADAALVARLRRLTPGYFQRLGNVLLDATTREDVIAFIEKAGG